MNRDTLAPDYTVLTHAEAQRMHSKAAPKRERRTWQPVIEKLERGEHLFGPFSDSDVKYLALVFRYRRDTPRAFRTRRDIRDGEAGRIIWLDD